MGRQSLGNKISGLFQLIGSCPPPDVDYLQYSIVVNYQLYLSHLPEIEYAHVLEEFRRASIAHSIVKLKLNSKHKHPYPELEKSTKHLADVYASVYGAIKEISFHTPVYEYGYSHGSEWFAFILYEFALCVSASNCIGKKSTIAALRKINSSLSSIQDGIDLPHNLKLEQVFPYDRAEHTYKFFRLLIDPCNPYPEMRQDLLGGILEAMKEYVTWLDQSKTVTVVSVDKGKTFATEGRGQNRQIRPNLRLKKC